jgi:hypothetical protein
MVKLLKLNILSPQSIRFIVLRFIKVFPFEPYVALKFEIVTPEKSK